jgi:hypothetical protein
MNIQHQTAHNDQQGDNNEYQTSAAYTFLKCDVKEKKL